MKKGIGYYYNHIEEILLVICILVMVVVIFFQVIMRYVFNNSLFWSEELARVLFIWVSWLGISLGEKKGEHIKITMVVDRLHGPAKKLVLLLADICTVAILAVLCVKGMQVVEQMLELGTKTSALGIPKSFVYAAVPVSCFLMAARILKEMVFLLVKHEKREVV